MELRHLRYFVAVAEERSFTRAAARLAIAQSPLSQQIRQLEREVGAPLFARTTRSVDLTYAGQIFYAQALGVLDASDHAIDAARKADRGEFGRLAVGFTGSATYELLPSLVRAYADRHPDVLLEIHSDMAGAVQVKKLLAGELAVGVLRTPVSAPGLVVETVRTEPIVALLASRHPAAVKRELDLSDLAEEWFISFPADPPSTMHTIMVSACEAAGFVPRVRQMVDNSAGIVALVAADTGVALVPASLRHLRLNGATFRPLRTPRITIGLALAYRDAPVDPLTRRFLEVARTVVRSREPVEAPTVPPITDDDRFTLEF